MNDNGDVNPWIRADLDSFNPETLALVPTGYQEDYTRVMKTLAHARDIANLALEQLYQAEAVRTAFFEKAIFNPDETYPNNVIDYAKGLMERGDAAA